MSKTAAVSQTAALQSPRKITLTNEQLQSGVRLAEKGDTFWSIAVALGVPVAEVIKANPEIDPKAIQYEGKNRTQINLPKAGAAASEKVETVPQNTWGEIASPAPVSDFQPPKSEQPTATTSSSSPGRNPGAIQADINAAKAEIQKLEAQLENPISAYDTTAIEGRNQLYSEIENLQSRVKVLQEKLRTDAGPAPATTTPTQPVDINGETPAKEAPAPDVKSTIDALKKEQADLKQALDALNLKHASTSDDNERSRLLEEITTKNKKYTGTFKQLRELQALAKEQATARYSVSA